MRRHPFTMMFAASSARVQDNSQMSFLINRRHALGLIAASCLLPERGFATVAFQRSEIRENLAKHFSDAGTDGTFVGY